MPYGDFACLDVRQRVAVLRALINLVLNTEDIHEYMQARVEAFHALRRAKAQPVPAEDAGGKPPASAAVPPPRGEPSLHVPANWQLAPRGVQRAWLGRILAC